MKSLKIDFKIDCVTGETISLEKYKKVMREKTNRKSGIYTSELADLYYREKYNKNIVEILSEKYEIPRCPITNELVSYILRGIIVFGRFSKSCTNSQITNYCLEHDESYKEKIKEFKEKRKGKGNPMYGRDAWNKGLTKNNDEKVKRISENRIGIVFSEETKERQSKSAKKRLIHGHTGIKHTEESKQKMREKTISRFKKGEFPQTNSLPHKMVKSILEEIFGVCGKDFFEEEGKFGFVFDFMVNNFLIEVQGDYFHCNPLTRHAIPKSDMQKKNIDRDKRKKNAVLKDGKYVLIELWENDIINNKQKIELCLKNLKK